MRATDILFPSVLYTYFLISVGQSTRDTTKVSKKDLKVQMKCFFILEFGRAAKIRKIDVYLFLISLLVPEL